MSDIFPPFHEDDSEAAAPPAAGAHEDPPVADPDSVSPCILPDLSDSGIGNFMLQSARSSLPWWLPSIVALLAGLGSFAWLWQRLPDGIVFGPWLGTLLEGDGYYATPWLSGWLVQHTLASLRLPTGEIPTLLSALGGALACAATALLAGQLASRIRPLASRRLSSLGVIISGLCAAAILALSSPLVYQGTGASPSTVTAALALLSLVAFVSTTQNARAAGGSLLCGLLGGLAAVNHSAFFLLLPLYTLGLVLFGRGTRETLVHALFLTAGFAFCATLPLLDAFDQGNSWNQVLSQMLNAPYPNVGDGVPDLDYGAKLFSVLPFGLFLLLVPGLFFHFSRGASASALLLLTVLLVFGPLMPFLTNQQTRGGLVDSEAPLLLVLGSAIALLVSGAAGLPQAFARGRGPGWLMPLSQILILSALAGVSWHLLSPMQPRRDAAWPRQTAQSILEGLPEGTLLLTGDRSIYSLLKGAQIADGLRPDVVLIPVEHLSQAEKRFRLAKVLPKDIEFQELFPDSESSNRWKHDLPFQFANFVNQETASDADVQLELNTFALWDFVSENLRTAPMAFAGVQGAWLEERATAKGLVSFYPQQEANSSPSPPLYDVHAAPNDPEGRRTISAMLLPLARRAIRQDEPQLGLQLAGLAADYLPGASAPALTVLEAQARMGEQEAVANAAEKFLDRWYRDISDDQLSTTILENLERHKDEARLRKFLDQSKDLTGDAETRHVAFDPLWAKGELQLLAQGYQRLLKEKPDDLDALYQLIAVRAQLGQFDEVDNLLVRWMHGSGISMADTITRLQLDGRFRHFQIYRGHALLPFMRMS